MRSAVRKHDLLQIAFWLTFLYFQYLNFKMLSPTLAEVYYYLQISRVYFWPCVFGIPQIHVCLLCNKHNYAGMEQKSRVFFTPYPRKILKVFARYKADKTSKFTRCTVTRCRPAKLKNLHCYKVCKGKRLKIYNVTKLAKLRDFQVYKLAYPQLTRTGKKISIIDVNRFFHEQVKRAQRAKGLV